MANEKPPTGSEVAAIAPVEQVSESPQQVYDLLKQIQDLQGQITALTNAKEIERLTSLLAKKSDDLMEARHENNNLQFYLDTGRKAFVGRDRAFKSMIGVWALAAALACFVYGRSETQTFCDEEAAKVIAHAKNGNPEWKGYAEDVLRVCPKSKTAIELFKFSQTTTTTTVTPAQNPGKE